MITNIEIELNILEHLFFHNSFFFLRRSLSPVIPFLLTGTILLNVYVCLRTRVIPVVDGRDNDK